MDRSYGLSDKGTIHVINVLKQRINTAGAKICRYNQRNLQYHQNNMFRNDQRKFYKELDGKMNGQIEAPDPKGSAEFWSKLWSEPVERSRDYEWLKKVKEKLRHTKTRKCYHHSEENKTSYRKNVQFESSRTRPYTRILV